MLQRIFLFFFEEHPVYGALEPNMEASSIPTTEPCQLKISLYFPCYYLHGTICTIFTPLGQAVLYGTRLKALPYLVAIFLYNQSLLIYISLLLQYYLFYYVVILSHLPITVRPVLYCTVFPSSFLLADVSSFLR